MNSETALATPQIQLDDVMLAMDVVDTLRHQQSLVDEALDADERDKALTARIRKIYHDQGIEVTDAIVANGVRALREEQFSYKPPPGGLKTHLARLYVNRHRARKPLVAVAAAGAVLWGGHFALSTLPEQRENAAAMDAYNTRVADVQNALILIGGKLDRAKQTLGQDVSVSPDVRALANSVRIDALASVDAALRLHDAASKISTKTLTDVDDYLNDGRQITSQLSERETLMRQLNSHVASIDNATELLDLLRTVPSEIAQVVSAVKSIAVEAAANARAAHHAENAIAALQIRDVAAVHNEVSALKNIANEIQQDYEVLIVSRPGEKSGVWRYPKDIANAKNYYLVVEAVTADGTRLPRQIVSEEDGTTRTVTQWAMRVEESIYNRVAADKSDDGIVQNKRFGHKKRGYLTPQYNIPTTGAAITNW